MDGPTTQIRVLGYHSHFDRVVASDKGNAFRRDISRRPHVGRKLIVVQTEQEFRRAVPTRGDVCSSGVVQRFF